MERKEKREYLRHNKTQFQFFWKESKRLQEEIEKIKDSSIIDNLREDLEYVRFRKDQESLFEDYLSDDFDEEIFKDELEGVRKKEIKYLQRKFSESENSSYISINNLCEVITQEISENEGLNKNDLKFKEKINPIVVDIIKRGNWKQSTLEDIITGAEKYNKDNYFDKFHDDLEMSKTISRITKENEEFMSMFNGHISGSSNLNISGIDSEMFNQFYEKFGDDFVNDLSSLEEKGTSYIPWIVNAEDQFSGESAQGWLMNESDLYSNLTDGTDTTQFNDLNILEKRLKEFNKKYNINTLSHIENTISFSELNKNKFEKNSSEYKGLTTEEIEKGKKWLETINISDSKKEEKNRSLEIPVFNNWDERAVFFRENFKELSEASLDVFKEKINPVIETSMKEFIIESIKYEITHRIEGRTFSGNVHSIDAVGMSGYIQRLIALKTGKVLDIDDVRRLSFRQVARDYLNITNLPEGFDNVFSDRIPEKEI
ncbi:MAG: hypothetical protein PF488_00455 [Patescibacteria group bacterium]|jgi:hypothetical protein|nr:hypothetical protein [Patescibacteria group bacterium]